MKHSPSVRRVLLCALVAGVSLSTRGPAQDRFIVPVPSSPPSPPASSSSPSSSGSSSSSDSSSSSSTYTPSSDSGSSSSSSSSSSSGPSDHRFTVPVPSNRASSHQGNPGSYRPG